MVNGAAKRLRNKVLKKEQEQIGDGEDIIACMPLTFRDLAKQGTLVKIRSCFCYTIDSGEILDNEVNSLFCHECKEHTC